MIGQHVIVGVHGTHVSDELKALISEFHIGGICFFQPPKSKEPTVEDPADICNRTYDFFRAATELNRQAAKGEHGPLFISIDQEGGRVQRLRAPFTVFPPMAAVGAYYERTHDTQLIKNMATLLALEMKFIGVNWIFAPVADVLTNPGCQVIGDRAFHHDPEIVSACLKAVIEAFEANHILSCAKHFPGHGDVTIDSHHALPVVSHDNDRLDRIELIPFRSAIAARVPAIMVGHLVVEAWDRQKPATLSRAVIGDHLIQNLQFDGLVVTDDLIMKAIQVPVAQAAVQAYEAGAHILLICHEPEKQIDAIETLIRHVEADIETRSKAIERSYKKIVTCKKQIDLKSFDLTATLKPRARFESLRKLQTDHKAAHLLDSLLNPGALA